MMEMDFMKIALTRLAKHMLSKTCKDELSTEEFVQIGPRKLIFGLDKTVLSAQKELSYTR